ncbi:MAG: tetratricopeptide repeat protein [Verrucomicrobia bacterium]|nr:tetratricopeptide repeat protein [Verrucomicrobiota bacterium]
MSTRALRMSLAGMAFLWLTVAAPALERLDEMATIGEEHMRSGKYTEAIKVYEKIMENPTYENILAIKFDLAWAYYLTGAFGKAIPLFTDLSSVRAPSAVIKAQALFLLADCYARLAATQDEKSADRKKNIQKSLELHTAFQTQNPKSANIPLSLYGRGYAYFLNSQYTEAEADLKNLMRLYSNSSAAQDANYLLASVYSQQGLDYMKAGRKDDAKRFMEKARDIFGQLTKTEGNPVTANDSMFALAETWFSAGLYNEAILSFREVRAKNEVLQILKSQIDKAQTQLGAQTGRQEDTTFVKGELDRLKAQWSAVSEGTDLVIASYLRIAQSNFEMGAYDVCRVICRHLIAFTADERKQQANYLLINTYLKDEDPDSAAREMEGFQQIFGTDAPIADTVSLAIGQLYLRQGTETGVANALAQFTKSVDEYPQGRALEDALNLKFTAEYVLNQYKEANQTIDAYLTKFPKGYAVPTALYYKAMCLVALNQPDEALKTIDQVIQQFPKKTETFDAVDEVFYQKGAMLVKAKKTQEAITHLETFLERFKDSKLRPEAMYQLGIALNTAGQTDKAKAMLEGIAQQYADNKIVPIALYQIAVIYYEKKDWGRMAEALETLIQICPQSEQVTDGFFWLGYIARQDGRFEDAIDYYTRCVESNPAYSQAPDCLLAIAMSYKDKADKMGQPMVLPEEKRALFRATLYNAAYAFEDLLANYPDSDQAQEAIPGMAKAIFDLVNYRQITEDEGGRFFVKAIARHKDNTTLAAQLSFGYGNFLMLNKQTDKALKAFKQAFATQTDVRLSPTMLASYAEALKEANVPAEAETIYNKIIADFPNDLRALAPAWYGLADIKFRQNDFAAAKPAFEKVLKDFPWYEPGKQGKVKLAQIFEKNKDYAQAEAMFTAVWQQEKGDARIGAMLGVSRCQLAQVQSANKPANWKELIRVCSENLTKIIVLYEAYPDYCSEAYLLQGQACELISDTAKAKEMYYKITTDYKNYPAAKPAAQRLQALGGYTPPAVAAPGK